MRILYLCNDPGIHLAGQSGGAIHIQSLVGALTDLGHQVTVVACSPVNEGDFQTGFPAAYCPAPLAGWNRALASVLRAGNGALGRTPRRNPDAVRALHNLTFYMAAAHAAAQLIPDFIYERYSLWATAGLRLARKRAVPLVLEVNAPLAYEQQHYRAGVTCPPLARRVEAQIWRKADSVITVSEELGRQLQKAGVKPERICVLPNAVDTQLFHIGVDGTALRQKLGLKGRFTVGFVGTFKKWHGVDLLLAAFQDFYDRDQSSHLVLVGEGPLRPHLEEEVRKAGLLEAVTFAGGVAHHDVPNYVAAMDVAVAPYPAMEGFYYSPLKLFEYMAAGRAVIASRVGQVAEVIEDGVTGLLFEPGNRADLLNCLWRMRCDPSARLELGRNASVASCVRTWSRNAAQVIERVKPLLEDCRLLAKSSRDAEAGHAVEREV